eukprot:6679960-Pyramimonas_sp.AAC.1
MSRGGSGAARGAVLGHSVVDVVEAVWAGLAPDDAPPGPAVIWTVVVAVQETPEHFPIKAGDVDHVLPADFRLAGLHHPRAPGLPHHVVEPTAGRVREGEGQVADLHLEW